MDVFQKGVIASYSSYFTDGARSKKKLVPLHGGIAEAYKHFIDLMADSPDDFEIVAEGYNGVTKEYNANSLTGSKNVDVAILYKGKFVLSNSVKFVTSNYGQNANNYIENAIGETVNLRLGEGNEKLVSAYTFIIAWKRPYLKKDGTVGRIENLSAKSIEMYRTLSNNSKIFPEHLIFSTIDTNNTKHFVKNGTIDWSVAGATTITFPRNEKEYLESSEGKLDSELVKFLDTCGDVEKQISASLKDVFIRNNIPLKSGWDKIVIA